ncbi:hypothetical protein RJT34_23675 [Clitoria ternatea]|uniref:GDSL esterase/lipase At5g03610-like n=1 Tax=Clitoria ternatea TaxID=43366 RepID=A0AAN9FPG5_CLITE
MDSHKQLFSLLCLPLMLLFLSGEMGLQVEGSLHSGYPSKKLFVFGDSYVDTGNTRKDVGPWMQPYGITFPGKPTGRFSDGLILTDFLAKYLGLKSPLPYQFRNVIPTDSKYGMNFAFGGTGVFNTSSSYPNMTTQIDFFTQLIQEKVYTASDLSNAVALVSVAGNDYYHFMSMVNDPSSHNLKDPLKPCCAGISSGYSCGSVDEHNVKKYTVCENTKTSFFWDLYHPTQAGWDAVYNNLQNTSALRQLRY